MVWLNGVYVGVKEYGRLPGRSLGFHPKVVPDPVNILETIVSEPLLKIVT